VLLLSMCLSAVALLLLLGLQQTFAGSADSNLTSITLKLLCSSFENLTSPQHSSPSSNLPLSIPSGPMVHARTLEKEHICSRHLL
jgi:hypothetical protein